MIYITENNDTGQIHLKKPAHSGTPESTGRTFTVRQCAAFWEVRCVTRTDGKITGDELVAVLPTEQEAEAAARWLANPERARERGKRTLEELIEEDRDGL